MNVRIDPRNKCNTCGHVYPDNGDDCSGEIVQDIKLGLVAQFHYGSKYDLNVYMLDDKMRDEVRCGVVCDLCWSYILDKYSSFIKKIR